MIEISRQSRLLRESVVSTAASLFRQFSINRAILTTRSIRDSITSRKAITYRVLSRKQSSLKSINASLDISHFSNVPQEIDFAIGRFHIETGRERSNKMHLIFARSFRRCRGVYWCRVPLAWGLPKYQSHTRLQIIYVYIARARIQHDIYTTSRPAVDVGRLPLVRTRNAT